MSQEVTVAAGHATPIVAGGDLQRSYGWNLSALQQAGGNDPNHDRQKGHRADAFGSDTSAPELARAGVVKEEQTRDFVLINTQAEPQLEKVPSVARLCPRDSVCEATCRNTRVTFIRSGGGRAGDPSVLTRSTRRRNGRCRSPAEHEDQPGQGAVNHSPNPLSDTHWANEQKLPQHRGHLSIKRRPTESETLSCGRDLLSLTEKMRDKEGRVFIKLVSGLFVND
ncbi:hypothetical protein SKAU_G00423860 [Synaphobranchus kaupii]|uniref:Uncharacterized protein n=1 Tax=Synaphobranchus kaupii TaxID=118154 RepID=A0A9Q1IAK9_SYNKA|nr:hypothetical protein SKAU_G00423860 [Synaphobranchus kaupii]